MRQDIAIKWVEALRSGKYQQGKFSLRSHDDRYCCLGVLCDVLKEQIGLEWRQKSSLTAPFVFGTQISVLSNDIINLVGMKQTEQDILSSMNDLEEKSFAEIADYIDANWRTL